MRRLIGGFGNTRLTSLVHYERALVAHPGGDYARTVEPLHVALALQHAQGLRPDAVRTLEALARTMADTESDVECVRLLSTTTALRSAMGLAHVFTKLEVSSRAQLAAMAVAADATIRPY